jgi:hypothetical protein
MSTAAKRRPRIRLHRNEHGGPMMYLSGPNEEGLAQISAVPQEGGDYSKGYVWIGTEAECFGHLEMRHFLAFADAIRRSCG